jgi:hypothetical protein
VKAEKKLSYVGPVVESCRVLLEGVVAITTQSIKFSGGSNIGSWEETYLGEANNPGLGGDVYVGSW